MPTVTSGEARAVRLALAGPVTLKVLARDEPGLALEIGGASESALESLRIKEDAGSVSVAGASAEWLTTPYDVTLRIGQPVSLDVAAPRIEVFAGADLDGLRVGGLTVEVEAAAVGALMAGFSSGAVVVADAGDVMVATASGSVRIGSCSGAARVKTASGAIAIERLAGEGHAKLGAASLAVGALSGRLDVKSSSGAVSVGIADGLPAWLDVSSQSGDVVIDVPATGPPDEGAPYAEVSVRAGSGDVHIYRSESK